MRILTTINDTDYMAFTISDLLLIMENENCKSAHITVFLHSVPMWSRKMTLSDVKAWKALERSEL